MITRGNRLRTIREERMHLTLEEVATLLQIDKATVSRHENGERGLSPEMVDRYARLYKVPSWHIFLNPADMPVSDNVTA